VKADIKVGMIHAFAVPTIYGRRGTGRMLAKEAIEFLEGQDAVDTIDIVVVTTGKGLVFGKMLCGSNSRGVSQTIGRLHTTN